MAGRFGKIHIGTSGWHYAHWKGIFYPSDLPARRHFEHYAQFFETVEINNTYYGMPDRKRLLAWCKKSPPGFVFAFKANRSITHRHRLKDAADPLRRFLQPFSAIRPVLGPVLFQLPPYMKKDTERLEMFLKLLSRRKKFDFVFEFRNKEWFEEDVRALLEMYRVGFCIFHVGDFTTPLWLTGDTVYLRFHGPNGYYQGKYSRTFLKQWASRIEAWAGEGKDVFAYFNNDQQAFAVQDALLLKKLAAGR